MWYMRGQMKEPVAPVPEEEQPRRTLKKHLRDPLSLPLDPAVAAAGALTGGVDKYGRPQAGGRSALPDTFGGPMAPRTNETLDMFLARIKGLINTNAPSGGPMEALPDQGLFDPGPGY